MAEATNPTGWFSSGKSTSSKAIKDQYQFCGLCTKLLQRLG
jgi:hypothetical protein